MLDKMFQQNASKFAMLLEYENQHSFFFAFHFMLHYFSLMDTLLHGFGLFSLFTALILIFRKCFFKLLGPANLQ